MFNTINNNPIKIGILEASSQNKAILEFFFSNSGKSAFKQTSVDDAEVFIIDYDFPGARESWENVFKETGQPGIILSIKEVELPSAIWIAKPLTTSALIEAASGVREFINNAKTPSTESFVVEPEKTEEVAQLETEEVVAEVKQVEKVKTKQTEQHAELAIAGSDDGLMMHDDDFSHEESAQAKPEKISEPAIDTMLELDTLNEVELDKEKVVDKQEIEMLSLDPEEFESTIEVNQEEEPEEIIADLDLMLPIVDLSSEEEKEEEEPAIDAMLEFDVVNDIDTQEDEDKQQIEVASELLVGNKKPNEEEEEAPKEVISNTKEISSATDYAVSDVMLDINLGETSKPVEIEKEEKSITPEEEEIDSLLESLIAGGKNKEEAIDISPEITTEVAQTEPELTPEVDIIDVDLELETINTDQKLELSTDNAISAEVRGIEDDATAIIVEEFTQSGETALEEEEVIADSIGEEIYINPEKPEVVKGKHKKESAEEELQKLLNELKQEAEDAADSIEPTQRTTGESGMHVPTEAEDRWNLTCGDNDEVKNPKDLDKSSFVLSNQMLSSFFDALEQSKYTKKVMRLKFKGHIIVIDYASDFIYCDNSIFSDSYAAVCFNPIHESKIKVHKLDKSEIRLYNTKRVENPENSHTIESFVWTTSLLTARGRLLKYTDMNKKVGLKYWPNLTRLEQIPHAMQIAAVFYKHPGSLMEVTKWLDIEQRYIFAFYNAALSLKLIELDSKKVTNTSGDFDGGSKKNRGFFARLLKRIKS